MTLRPLLLASLVLSFLTVAVSACSDLDSVEDQDDRGGTRRVPASWPEPGAEPDQPLPESGEPDAGDLLDAGDAAASGSDAGDAGDAGEPGDAGDASQS